MEAKQRKAECPNCRTQLTPVVTYGTVIEGLPEIELVYVSATTGSAVPITGAPGTATDAAIVRAASRARDAVR
jgi:hypothetical protein